MITVEDVNGKAYGGKFTLIGKSTDNKPIGKYMGMAIENGSTFFEIDTQEVKFYDGETNSWI